MTETLNEQFEFLKDAWQTLLHYVQEYSIMVDRDEAFGDMKYAKKHATRVIEMAFCISDQFKQTNGEKRQVADVIVEEDTDDLPLTEEMVPKDNNIHTREASRVVEARQITDHTEIAEKSMDDETENGMKRGEWEKHQDFIFDNVLQCNWSILTMIDAVIAK